MIQNLKSSLSEIMGPTSSLGSWSRVLSTRVLYAFGAIQAQDAFAQYAHHNALADRTKSRTRGSHDRSDSPYLLHVNFDLLLIETTFNTPLSGKLDTSISRYDQLNSALYPSA